MEKKKGDKMLNRFLVKFDFTTVHRGSRFVGRSGECEIQHPILKELDPKNDVLLSCCAQSILLIKPEFKIFMVNITEITPIT